jgi:hypothetical protein
MVGRIISGILLSLFMLSQATIAYGLKTEEGGNHQTVIQEAAALKNGVHAETDNDNGEEFSKWLFDTEIEDDESVLDILLDGVEDEDNMWYDLTPLEGVNGDGNYFQHFRRKDGKGLLGAWASALERARDNYLDDIDRLSCETDQSGNLSPRTKRQIYDYFGRIMHLLQDMFVPAHARNDIHVFWETFEDYINNNWSDIVSSDWYNNAVSTAEYQKLIDDIDDYGIDIISGVDKYFTEATETSSNYPSDGLGTLDEEVVASNVKAILPLAVTYTGAYLNKVYEALDVLELADGSSPDKVILLASLESDVMTLASLLDGLANASGGGSCEIPQEISNPGGGHPDDNYEVSNEFYLEDEYGLSDYDLTELYLRTAIKKGKIGVWYKKLFMDIFMDGRVNHMDSPDEVKAEIEAGFQAVKEKLSERFRLNGDSEWQGAPDVAVLKNGFHEGITSLLLRYKDPMRFAGLDLDPSIVSDHPVLVIPSGGLYGMESSEFFKSALDEYVKQSGTLVVFGQQSGYEFNAIPVPMEEDGTYNYVNGYGWSQDQQCFTDGTYIENWHPMLAAQTRSTPTANVDGFFSSYPSNSTVILRRTANGQPALLTYAHGAGRVIVSSMYTDWAYGHAQAANEELAIVRDMIAWAKAPAELTEISRHGRFSGQASRP